MRHICARYDPDVTEVAHNTEDKSLKTQQQSEILTEEHVLVYTRLCVQLRVCCSREQSFSLTECIQWCTVCAIRQERQRYTGHKNKIHVIKGFSRLTQNVAFTV